MYLNEILRAQKQGEARGITSVCSAHSFVLRQTLRTFAHPLIEATCNQVNQYGGYTGLTPAQFAEQVRALAREAGVRFEQVILGGDHLGPNVWQAEPAEVAMEKSRELVRDYVRSGFVKIHLDCSMRLGDDPSGPLDVEVSANRSAQLARVAEEVAAGAPQYVIGTEVPIPGGATEHEEAVRVTQVRDARATIEATRAAFMKEGLEAAWERVMAVVVQPGVEFGDDFVLAYRAGAARELSHFIEGQPLVYEAHSTDYQAGESLAGLVRDHFAVLKVGPELTFAFREAVFALAMMEDELLPGDERSNIVQVIDGAMLKEPWHWSRYYAGDEHEQAFKRKYSLSDRLRYYWSQPEVVRAYVRLMHNLGERSLPPPLLSQFGLKAGLTAEGVIESKVGAVMGRYKAACGTGS